MRKVLVLILVMMVSALVVFFLWLRSIPQMEYSKLLKGESSSLYTLTRYDPKWLPAGIEAIIPEPKEDLSELWREFQLMDVRLPLPTRHPKYITLPVITHKNNNEGAPDLGLSFKAHNGRELVKIYLFKHSYLQMGEESQKLFKLPIAKKLIKQLEPQKIWRDLFLKDLRLKTNSAQEMIYNLYILSLRSTYFPNNILQARLMPDQKRAIIEVDGLDKDFKMEWVLTGENGFISSFLILTQKDSVDAEDLRNKLLFNVIFEPSSPSLTPLIYREFKELSFKRQIDQEGMLYLFSAWSHDLNNLDLLKEMIYFLERGLGNSEQLKPLYYYSYARYKRTFSTRDAGVENLDPQVKLQMNIEWEEKSKNIKLQEAPATPVKSVEELPARERMDSYLEKIRQGKDSKKDDKVKFD